MINNLAVELAAPEFMKTDLVQVRHIRMARMVFLPNLINQPPRGQSGANRRTKGSSVNETMSPLEAVFFSPMDLIYQKTNSDDFQVSPREYRSNLNKKRLEM